MKFKIIKKYNQSNKKLFHIFCLECKQTEKIFFWFPGINRGTMSLYPWQWLLSKVAAFIFLQNKIDFQFCTNFALHRLHSNQNQIPWKKIEWLKQIWHLREIWIWKIWDMWYDKSKLYEGWDSIAQPNTILSFIWSSH